MNEGGNTGIALVLFEGREFFYFISMPYEIKTLRRSVIENEGGIYYEDL